MGKSTSYCTIYEFSFNKSCFNPIYIFYKPNSEIFSRDYNYKISF